MVPLAELDCLLFFVHKHTFSVLLEDLDADNFRRNLLL